MPEVNKFQPTTFTTSRLLDFCSEQGLRAETGQPVENWPLYAFKELVDDSLDACEEAAIAPVVSVTVGDGKMVVTDNGPGIPNDTVEGLLDFTMRVSSREAYVSPTRGAQGNALKTIIAMPFVLDGRSGRTRIEAHGIAHDIEMNVDLVRQEPRLTHTCSDSVVKNGTRITLLWPDQASSILAAARDGFLQMAGAFTYLNPHQTLNLSWHGTELLNVPAAGSRLAEMAADISNPGALVRPRPV